MKSKFWSLIQLAMLSVAQGYALDLSSNSYRNGGLTPASLSQRLTIRDALEFSVLMPRTNNGGKSPKPSSASAKPGASSSAADTKNTPKRPARVKPPRTEAQKQLYNQRKKDARLARTPDQKLADSQKQKEAAQRRNKGKSEEEIKDQRKNYAASAAAKRTPEENKAMKRKYHETEFAKETPEQTAARKARLAINYQKRKANMTPEERRKWQDDKNAKARQARRDKKGEQENDGEGTASQKRKSINTGAGKRYASTSPEPELSDDTRPNKRPKPEADVMSGTNRPGGRLSSPLPGPPIGAGGSSPSRIPQSLLSPPRKDREDSPALLDNPNAVYGPAVPETFLGNQWHRSAF